MGIIHGRSLKMAHCKQNIFYLVYTSIRIKEKLKLMQLETEMLMHAARSGNTQVLEELNEVNINQKDSNNDTALILATKYRQYEAVSLLLDKGASVDETDNEGNSALLWAAFNGDLAITELLIANKSSLDLQREDGTTALMLAIMAGQSEIVKLLLLSGADTETCNAVGLRAADLAQQQDNTEILEMLGV